MNNSVCLLILRYKETFSLLYVVIFVLLISNKCTDICVHLRSDSQCCFMVLKRIFHPHFSFQMSTCPIIPLCMSTRATVYCAFVAAHMTAAHMTSCPNVHPRNCLLRFCYCANDGRAIDTRANVTDSKVPPRGPPASNQGKCTK
jgi:hypothetical protein